MVSSVCGGVGSGDVVEGRRRRRVPLVANDAAAEVHRSAPRRGDTAPLATTACGGRGGGGL